MVVIRDLGYMYRIRVLTDKYLSWRKSFDVIMLWEFASALTPSVVGGSGIAIFILNREKINQRQKQYYESHKDEIKAKNANYYSLNREKIKGRSSTRSPTKMKIKPSRQSMTSHRDEIDVKQEEYN